MVPVRGRFLCGTAMPIIFVIVSLEPSRAKKVYYNNFIILYHHHNNNFITISIIM
jgi:hypothetical protein